MDSSLNASVSRPQVPVTPDKTASRDKGSTQASTANRVPKKSFHSTPISARNTSFASILQNKKLQEPRLAAMNVIRGHPDFFSTLLPSLPDQSDFSESCLRCLPRNLWNEKTRRFGFTSSERETDMYDPLVNTLNAILGFKATESASTPSSLMPPRTSSKPLDSWTPLRYEFVRTDQDFASREVLSISAKGEPYYNRMPDIAMVLKKYPNSHRSWYDVALSIEVKKDPKKAAVEQAEDQAEAILTNAPTKRFLYSIILCNSLLEVCLWDRAGVITSKRIDVNDNPLGFIEIVRRFASMSPVELGFDQTTTDLPDGVLYPMDRGPIGSPIVSIDGEIYYRIQTLAGSSSCFGRSTRCFEARKLIKSEGKWSNKTYLLKYFWNDVKRQPDEGKIYERIKTEGAKVGVADFVCFVRLSKLSVIRRGLPLLNGDKDSDMEKYAREEDEGEETESEVKKENFEREEVKGIIDREVSGDRQLCVLVLASVGRSISKPTTIHELISATRAAIKGHQAIYEKAGILHRDISTNNIRIRDPPKVFMDGINEEPSGDASTSWDEGFLIDFDLSLMDNCDDNSRSQRLERTGTFSFMAWQILKNAQGMVIKDDKSSESLFHGYKHDLQSFFWVLLYICTGSPTFTQKPLDTRHPSIAVMRIFSAPAMEYAAATKRVYLMDPFVIWVAEPFEGMVGVLSKMKALLHPAKWDDLTHDAFILILDEALQDPTIQEQALILQHKFEPSYLISRYQKPGVPTRDDQPPASGFKSGVSGSHTLDDRPTSDSGSGSGIMICSRTRKHSHSSSSGSASNSRAIQGQVQHLSSSVSRKRTSDPPRSSGESKRSRKG